MVVQARDHLFNDLFRPLLGELQSQHFRAVNFDRGNATSEISVEGGPSLQSTVRRFPSSERILICAQI
jgi:hypothetical protein